MKNKIVIFVFDIFLLLGIAILLAQCFMIYNKFDFDYFMLVLAGIGGFVTMVITMFNLFNKCRNDLFSIVNHKKEKIFMEIMARQIIEQEEKNKENKQ